jgi:hypothetical protein
MKRGTGMRYIRGRWRREEMKGGAGIGEVEE